MKMNSGSITVNKNIDHVFSFTIDKSKLSLQAKYCAYNEFDIEFDDDIDGELQENELITLYAFSNHEDKNDFFMDMRVNKILKNRYITFSIDRAAIYDKESDEYEDARSIPAEFIWKNLEFGMFFSGINGKTEVSTITYVKPSAGYMFKLFAWLYNIFGYFENKKRLALWGKGVEQYA